MTYFNVQLLKQLLYELFASSSIQGNCHIDRYQISIQQLNSMGEISLITLLQRNYYYFFLFLG